VPSNERTTKHLQENGVCCIGDLYSAVTICARCAWLLASDIFTLGVSYRQTKAVEAS